MALSLRAQNYARDVIDNGLIQKAIDAGAHLLPICPVTDSVAQEIRDEITARGKTWQDAASMVCLRVADGGDIVYRPDVSDGLPVIDLTSTSAEIADQIATVLELNGMATVKRE